MFKSQAQPSLGLPFNLKKKKGMPRFIAFHFTALQRYCVCGNLGQACLLALFSQHYLHSSCLCHILVILTIFQKKFYCYICNGTCDQSSLMLQLQNDYYSLEGQVMVSIFSNGLSLIILHF